LHFGDALERYDTWPTPTVIVSDGPYGVSGYPGDPPTHAPLAEMFDDNPFEHSGAARMVPDPFGIDDRDRAGEAHAQTADFAAQYPGMAAQPDFAQPMFEKVPAFAAGFARRTFVLVGIDTQENVALRGKPAQLCQRAFSLCDGIRIGGFMLAHRLSATNRF